MDCGCVGVFCKCVGLFCKCADIGVKCMNAQGFPEGGPLAHRNGQHCAVGHDGMAQSAFALHLGHAVEVDDGVVMDADERIRRQGLLEMAQALGAGDGRHINKAACRGSHRTGCARCGLPPPA